MNAPAPRLPSKVDPCVIVLVCQTYVSPQECREQAEKVYAVQPRKDGDAHPAQVQIDRIDDGAVVDGDKDVVETVYETPR